MISLEMARKLKDAGLEWEPKVGDFLYWNIDPDGNAQVDVLNTMDIDSHMNETLDNIEEGNWIFLPRLDQLLAEIEKRGYEWAMAFCRAEGYATQLWNIGKKKKLAAFESKESSAEATAKALLWILERGA